MRSIVLLAVLALCLLSCHKEERDRYRVAGAWKITNLNLATYENGVQKSVTNVPEAGTLMLSDNRASQHNRATYHFNGRCPASIVEFASQLQLDTIEASISWYPGPSGTERATFWGPGPLHDIFVMYSVYDLDKSSMKFSWVKTDTQGRMRYKEVWTLER